VRSIGIRELKNRLSEVVRAVKGGEHVLVTNRGAVVAELVPPGRSTLASSLPSGLARLVARGVARQGAANDPRLYENLPQLRRTPASTARLLDHARGKR
jgi:prevent-host-death family protein